jgi:predicted small lipoprotein YifL
MRTLLLALLVIAAWGCGQNAPTDDPNAANAPDQQMTESGLKPVQDMRGNEPVINSPSQVEPGGAYRIQPADPNDEKYKPDPKLAGGG